MILIKGKNWSYVSGRNLSEYKYIRFRFMNEEKIEESIWCKDDECFYLLLDQWNRENRHSKFFGIERVKEYIVETNALWNERNENWDIVDWKEIFSSQDELEIRRFLLNEGIECRYVRVRTAGIDNEIKYIYNVSLLLGRFESN